MLLVVAALFAFAATTPYRTTNSAAFHSASPQLHASVSGRVHLAVKDGELVRAGQEIATVEPGGGEIAGTVALSGETIGALRPPCPATLILDSGRHVPVTIASVSPAVDGTAEVHLIAQGELPPHTRATLSVPGPEIPLLRQLLRRTTP
jgi:hypothetical protein